MSPKKLHFNVLIQDKSIGGFVVILTSILSFLACFALLFLLNTERQYQDWQKVLNQTFFVEFMPDSKKDDDLGTLNATLQFLQSTKGVLSVRVIPESEAQGLLKPWLGGDEAEFKHYRLPIVIDVTTDLSLSDLQLLEQNLKQQYPQVHITARDAWSDQLTDYSISLKFLAIFVFGLILLGLAVIVYTAAKMGVLLQGQFVDLLKLMGAPYRFISRQFERFFTVKVVKGAVLGVVLSISFFYGFLFLHNESLVLMKHFLVYEDVFYLLLIPIFLLLLSYFVSRITTSHFLNLEQDVNKA